MKFEIKNRWNDSVLFSLECAILKLCVEAAVKAKADLSGADLSEAYLRWADLSEADLHGADLHGADLSEADLRWADLREADLREADLREANLRWANLSEADLSGADLRGADLRGADLSEADLSEAIGDFATPEESEATLARIAEIVLANPERLEMIVWHGQGWDATHTPEEEHSCKTAHCMAGWAQALCPVPLIRRMDPVRAGIMLIPTASHMFYATNEDALKFLKSKLRPGAEEGGRG